jgi:hypothetical protein
MLGEKLVMFAMHCFEKQREQVEAERKAKEEKVILLKLIEELYSRSILLSLSGRT